MTNRKTWIDALTSTSAYSIQRRRNCRDCIWNWKEYSFVRQVKNGQIAAHITISLCLLYSSRCPYIGTNNFNLFLMHIGLVRLLLVYATLLMCWLAATAFCVYALWYVRVRLSTRKWNDIFFAITYMCVFVCGVIIIIIGAWWPLCDYVLKIYRIDLQRRMNGWSPFGLWLFHFFFFFSFLSVRAAAYVQWKGPFFLRIKLIL